MGASLDDAALFQYHDAVAVSHGGKPVGNDEGGASMHEPVHALLDDLLCPGIDGAGGLIQDEHRRVCDSGPGNGKKLALALA